MKGYRLITLGALCLAVLQAGAQSSGAPPSWTWTFNDANDFEEFTVIDANDDASQSGYFKWGTWDYLFRGMTDSPYGDEYPSHCVGYTNSEDNDGDDWLITPALSLEGGKSYTLKYKVRAHRASCAERMEVKFGTTPTAAGMTTTVLPARNFTNTRYEELSGTLKPSATGTYYVGFHALSNTDSYILYLDDISLKETVSAQAPDSVTGLRIVASSNADISDTLKFTTPATASDRTILRNLGGVKIYREGKQITDLTNVGPDEEVSYFDGPAASQPGYVSYSVIPYNAAGNGPETKAQAWVGLDAPTTPEGVTVKVETDKLNVNWSRSKAEHGGVLPESSVYYSVNAMTNETTPARTIKTVAGANSTTISVNPESGSQGLLLIGIQASNNTGTSGYGMAKGVVIGKPYDAPFFETFGKNGNTYPFWENDGEGFGYSLHFASIGTSADEDASGDGGAAMLRTYYEDSLAIISGKISLAGTEAPKLAYSQKTKATSGTIIPFVIKADGSRVSLGSEELGNKDAEGNWTRRQYDLSAFKDDKYVRVGIAFDNQKALYKDNRLYIDNFYVGDIQATDLAVAISAPKKMRKGKTAKVTVKVSNLGEKAAAFSLNLSDSYNTIADTTVAEAINPSGYKTFSFDYTPSVLNEDESTTLTAKVAADGDSYDLNDEASAPVELYNLDVAGIKTLTLRRGIGSQMRLSWTPEAEKTQLTDDFEDYEPWSIDGIGDWTFIDADEGLTAGYFDSQQLYYENERTPFAFIVWHPTTYGNYDITATYPEVKPYSGENCLASVYSYHLNSSTLERSPLDADNWLVSPKLTGKAQTFSFKVSNMNTSYPETFEVLYSTTGNNEGDFRHLADGTVSNGQWNTASYDLPEGATYFAIRHNTQVVENFDGSGYSSNPWLLMIDDVTFSPLACLFDHYNVYHNGKLIGSTTSTSFTDNEASSGAYQVTAVYADGTESAPATATSLINGIKEIEAEGNPETGNAKGTFTISGMKVKEGRSLSPGVYIRNGKKLIVR